jgi:hypothetical protein
MIRRVTTRDIAGSEMPIQNQHRHSPRGPNADENIRTSTHSGYADRAGGHFTEPID